MILLIDNYDSFSYNLVQLIGAIVAERAAFYGTKEEEIRVIRNDDYSLQEIRKWEISRVILSPGPGRPCEAGICEEVVLEMKGLVPILGVCLGHQGICEAFGATITYAQKLMHGKQSRIWYREGEDLFGGLSKEVLVARYHSLVVDPDSMPDELEAIAWDREKGEIMAVRHREYPIYGMQFHPESVLTPDGKKMMENFFSL